MQLPTNTMETGDREDILFGDHIEDEKPTGFNICQPFNKKDDLKECEHIHEEIIRVYCDLCDKTFCTSGYMGGGQLNVDCRFRPILVVESTVLFNKSCSLVDRLFG